MILCLRASISPPDGPEQPIENFTIPAPRTWLWTVLCYPFLQAIKHRWGLISLSTQRETLAHVLIVVYSLPPSTFQPPGLRTQVGPWWDKLFLAPTAKASGAFHLSRDKGCSRCAVQGSGLTAPCAVGLWFAFTCSRCVWDALLGKETEPGHARLLSDLSLCVWGQLLQLGDRGQALWGSLQAVSYFQRHFGVCPLLQFSSLKVTNCFPFIISFLSSFFLPWNCKSQFSIFWLYSPCQSCNITFQIWQYHLLTSPYE